MQRYLLSLGLAASLVLPSCVKNPNVTEDVYVNTPNAARSWANGVRRQLALTLNAVVVNAELISDNYYNNYTQNSKVFDIPQIDYFDVDVNATQAEVQRLREMALYGLTKVVPGDASTTAADKASLLFSHAYAYLLSGEVFVALPGSSRGEVLSSTQHLQKALGLWDEAIAAEPDAARKVAYTLLKARTYYALGDAVNASKLANEVLAQKSVLLQVAYDGLNGVSNEMQTGTFVAQPNRFAPLPRLDFLDPKYFNVGVAAQEQKPIAIAKGEEAYLILAEVQLAAGDLATARTTLQRLLTEVVALRTVTAVDDSKETRNGGNRKDYPLTAMKVKFDAGDAPRDGYVLNRQAGKVNVYGVSGTKVTTADLSAATTTDALLYLLYRMRQELFMGEGRRMLDLGIKFPVSQTEQLNNPNVKAEHIQAQLPSFIPLSRGMDDFTVDVANGIVTMKYDMNKVLVQNKTAKEIFPFIN
jgi:tetratricopeptide (TPR) repeat protein